MAEDGNCKERGGRGRNLVVFGGEWCNHTGFADRLGQTAGENEKKMNKKRVWEIKVPKAPKTRNSNNHPPLPQEEEDG